MRGWLALQRRLAVSALLLWALALTVSCGGKDPDDSTRWAALPRTLGCTVQPAGGTVQDVPPSLQVRQVTIRDEGGQRLAIALEFPGGVPPDPKAAKGPYGVRSAPGSVSMSILVLPTGSHDEDPYLVITSPQPATGRGWNAEVASGNTDANALQSATVSGTTRTLVVDLRNDVGALGSGEFKADVHIIMTVSRTPPTMPIILSAQHCDWDRSVRASTSAARPPTSPRASLTPDTPSSPPAQGNKVVTATTRLQWAGSRCISILSARQDDRTRTGEDRICADSGTWRYSEEATFGQLIGGDPLMGDADWIACQLYINGQLEFSDKADAADGSDVNCLRTLN